MLTLLSTCLFIVTTLNTVKLRHFGAGVVDELLQYGTRMNMLGLFVTQL